MSIGEAEDISDHLLNMMAENRNEHYEESKESSSESKSSSSSDEQERQKPLRMYINTLLFKSEQYVMPNNEGNASMSMTFLSSFLIYMNSHIFVYQYLISMKFV